MSVLGPAAQADLVDVVGGFTQYFGPLERPAGPPGSALDRQTYFSIPGAYSFAASPSAPYDDLPIAWQNGIGSGNAGFVGRVGETRAQIDFFIGTADGATVLPANSVVFTPTTGADVQVGSVFKLGTFRFTNGAWLGGLPDSLFQMSLRTVSANPALDGHTLSTYLGLHVTDGLSADGSRYSPDPVDNADYFYLTSSPFFGEPTEVLGYVGVYEAEPELQPPGGSNTGAIDLYGRIGSLVATGFANPQGVTLQAGIPVVSPLPVPEPGSWALLLAGLATLLAASPLRVRARRRALSAVLPVALAGLSAPALACSAEHAVLGLFSPDMFIAQLLPGATLTNTDPAGCHAIFPLWVNHGATFVNRAKLSNELGSLDGPNGRGGLLVGGLFDNQRGATVINSGEFFVGGPLDARGVLKNAGSFVNARLLDVSGGLLDNTGSLDNTGTLRNDGRLASSGQLYNTGTLTTLGSLANTGTLTNQGTVQFMRSSLPFAASPRFSNVGGVLENRVGAVLDFSNAFVDAEAWAGGSLRNSGTLRGIQLSTGAPGAGTVSLLGQGTVENSVLSVAAGHSQRNDGRLLNTRIQVQPGGSLVHNGYSDGRADLEIAYGHATLSNTAAISVDRSTLSNGGTLLNTGGVDVKAQGRIHNGFVHSDGTVVGQLQNDGVLQVAAGGRIDNLAVLRSSRTLYNAGTIDNPGELDNSGRFDNAGVFSSAGVLGNGGTTVNTGSFLVGGSLALGGSFFNSGEVVFGVGSVTTGAGVYRQTAGATRVDGSIDIGSFSLIGGSLCGSGSIQGAVVVRSGTLCPGNSPGTLHIGGNLSLINSDLEIEIAGTAPGRFDVLQVGGSISFAGGVLKLRFADGYLPSANAHWAFLDAAGGVAGLQTMGLEVTGLARGYALAIGPNGLLAVSAVPEPGSLALMLAGTVGLAWRGRRRGGRAWAKMRPCCSNAPSDPSPAPSAWACTAARRLS